MNKIYFKLLAIILPLAVSAQVVSVSDTLSVAFYSDLTISSNSSGNTVTLSLTENAGQVSDILNIEIYRNFTYNRIKDRVRIAAQVPMPANGTFVFVDDNETYTRNTSNTDDYGYDPSGIFPVGEPASYTFSVIMNDATNTKFVSNRTAHAVYVENYSAPDSNVTDNINDAMVLWTRAYNSPSEDYAILAIGLKPSTTYPTNPYDLLQDAIIARTGSDINWASYPCYGEVYANEVAALGGRNKLSDMFWFGNEGIIYHRIDKADILETDIDATTGMSYISFKFLRPNSSQPSLGLTYNSLVSVPIQVTSAATASFADETLSNFAVYPNPSKGIINFSGDNVMKSIEVYNLVGKRTIQRNSINNTNTSINLSNHPPGAYFAKIETEVGTLTKKVILE